MIRLTFAAAAAALLVTIPDQATACSTTDEVMAHFENVKNAYVAKAPSMTPEQFPIWTGHLEQFGDAMGRSDFAGACAALDAAAVELGFDVAPAIAAGAGDDPAGGKAAGASTGKAGTSDDGAATTAGAAADGDTATGGAVLQPQAGAGTAGQVMRNAVWTECPRGRCRFRDRGS